jgi:hypothetical protein
VRWLHEYVAIVHKMSIPVCCDHVQRCRARASGQVASNLLFFATLSRHRRMPLQRTLFLIVGHLRTVVGNCGEGGKEHRQTRKGMTRFTFSTVSSSNQTTFAFIHISQLPTHPAPTPAHAPTFIHTPHSHSHSHFHSHSHISSHHTYPSCRQRTSRTRYPPISPRLTLSSHLVPSSQPRDLPGLLPRPSTPKPAPTIPKMRVRLYRRRSRSNSTLFFPCRRPPSHQTT